jgi:hypothetical protein
MNGQIVLYMECYPLTCSNRLSYFIELTGARVEDSMWISNSFFLFD